MTGGSGDRRAGRPELKGAELTSAGRRPVPRGASGIASDASLFEEFVGARASAGAGLETEWLYEQDGQVFGPISTQVLLEQLYDGTLTPDTPVAVEDGEFRAIRRIGAFRSHLPRIAAHQAEQARAKTEAQARTRRLMIRRLGWGVVGLATVALGSAGVMTAVRYQRQLEAEAARKAQEAALQAELDALMASVTIEPPLASLVRDTALSRRPDRRRRRRRTSSAQRGTGALTRKEIVGGLRQAFGGFKRCIVEQIQRDKSSVGPQIVLTFSIGNEGRAKNIGLADRFLRRSPMLGCFQRRMGKLHWRRFKGEVRNIEYPISVRR